VYKTRPCQEASFQKRKRLKIFNYLAFSNIDAKNQNRHRTKTKRKEHKKPIKRGEK